MAFRLYPLIVTTSYLTLVKTVNSERIWNLGLNKKKRFEPLVNGF